MGNEVFPFSRAVEMPRGRSPIFERVPDRSPEACDRAAGCVAQQDSAGERGRAGSRNLLGRSAHQHRRAAASAYQESKSSHWHIASSAGARGRRKSGSRHKAAQVGDMNRGKKGGFRLDFMAARQRHGPAWSMPRFDPRWLPARRPRRSHEDRDAFAGHVAVIPGKYPAIRHLTLLSGIPEKRGHVQGSGQHAGANSSRKTCCATE